jgi:hypothetical protein
VPTWQEEEEVFVPAALPVVSAPVEAPVAVEPKRANSACSLGVVPLRHKRSECFTELRRSFHLLSAEFILLTSSPRQS